MQTKLECTNISITADDKQVVDEVSFAVSSGEVHVIMGANGSGKSSFVNALMGHPRYTISSGTMTLSGEDILSLSPEKKAQAGMFLSMQYLPEIDGVSLTNFLYRAYKAVKNSELSVVEFYGLLKSKAQEVGVDATFLARDVNVGLSGGEKKLSEILQMAILEPRFAFLDEIDSGVDIDALDKIYGAIKVVNKEVGTGIVLITHNTEVLNHITPDKVHVMRGGKLVVSGGVELVERIKKDGFTGIE